MTCNPKLFLLSLDIDLRSGPRWMTSSGWWLVLCTNTQTCRGWLSSCICSGFLPGQNLRTTARGRALHGHQWCNFAPLGRNTACCSTPQRMARSVWWRGQAATWCPPHSDCLLIPLSWLGRSPLPLQGPPSSCPESPHWTSCACDWSVGGLIQILREISLRVGTVSFLSCNRGTGRRPVCLVKTLHLC